MTPQELRDMVAKATPGPWYFRPSVSLDIDRDDFPDVRDRKGHPSAIVLQGEECFLPEVEVSNLRLAALAPQLALLLADMAEFAAHMEKHWGGGIAGSSPLLARFAALSTEEES